MSLTNRRSYPVAAISCAVLYGIFAVVVAGLMVYLNPYEVLSPDDAARLDRGEQPLYEKYTQVYWDAERVLYCLAIPLPLFVGGMLALVRPRWAGWVYLAGAIASLAALANILSTSSQPGMAGTMAGLAALVYFALLTLPMLLLSWLLLKKRSVIEVSPLRS